MKVAYILLMASGALFGLTLLTAYFFPKSVGLMTFLIVLSAIFFLGADIIGINNDFSGKGNGLSRLKKYTCRFYNFLKGNTVNKNTTLPTDEPDIELSNDYKKYTKIGLVLMGIAVASVFISVYISIFSSS